jgi:hypothetical protein
MNDEFASELWIACFVKDGRKIIRKFWAAGYYNAYDRALSYAERRRLDILWFKEKRSCYELDHKTDYIDNAKELESFCIYCNAIINESNIIECDICNAIICSRKCYNGHMMFRHKINPK